MPNTAAATTGSPQAFLPDEADRVLDEIDLLALRLTRGQRREFLERQHAVWCREYGRAVCSDPEMDATDYIRVVVGISARIYRLPR